MSKFVYHYHAILQVRLGEVEHFDGIINRDEKFKGTFDEYEQLKKDIGEKSNPPNLGKITICSLALIG